MSQKTKRDLESIKGGEKLPTDQDNVKGSVRDSVQDIKLPPLNLNTVMTDGNILNQPSVSQNCDTE